MAEIAGHPSVIMNVLAHHSYWFLPQRFNQDENPGASATAEAGADCRMRAQQRACPAQSRRVWIGRVMRRANT